MTLKQLEYFMTLAKTLNYSEASKELFISQPALSRSIAALEEEIETALFTRDKHHVALTTAGLQFARELPKLASALSRTVIEIQQIEEGQKGKLLLGLLDGLPLHPAISYALSHISEVLPEYEVFPVCLNIDDLTKSIHTNEIDLMYSYDTNLPFDSALNSLPLCQDYFCMAMSEELYEKKQSPSKLKDFQTERFYFSGNESSFELHRWKEICAIQGIMPRFVSVINIPTQIFCIEHGYGVTPLPSCHNAFNVENIKKIELKESLPLQINLKWNIFNPNPCVDTFLKIVRDYMASHRD
ncbi:MAG: LysR family transcriptional regulator [Eubacterium sp.]|nr:LysR family transcriptional regulator [Eubacterium sp.]